MNVVLGATGFIGARLYADLKRRESSVVGTCTPRHIAPGQGLIPYDLAGSDPAAIPVYDAPAWYYFCTQFGGIDFCKSHPQQTAAANVSGVIRVLERIRAHPATPVFLSTNMVFDGARPDYRETDPVNPVTEYGRQKAVVEQYIARNFERYLIVRLTKVYGGSKSDKTLFSSWFDTWLAGERICAAPDSYIAPLYVGDVIVVLRRLVEERVHGIVHVSGPVMASVSEFACLAASVLGAGAGRVEERPMDAFGFPEQRPRFNHLACDRLPDIMGGLSLTRPETVLAALRSQYAVSVQQASRG